MMWFGLSFNIHTKYQSYMILLCGMIKIYSLSLSYDINSILAVIMIPLGFRMIGTEIVFDLK